MSSIFSPFFGGQKTSFFCCFLDPKSAQNHYMLWPTPIFFSLEPLRVIRIIASVCLEDTKKMPLEAGGPLADISSIN